MSSSHVMFSFDFKTTLNELERAIRDNDASQFEELLNSFPAKEQLGEKLPADGRKTPLMLALERKQWSAASKLIQHHITALDACDSDGRTALMYPQTLQTVKLCCERGANINKRALDGQNVLMWSLRNTHVNDTECEVTKYLLSRNAKVDAKDAEGRSIFMTAVWQDKISILELLKGDKRILEPDLQDRTVLHHLTTDVARSDGTEEQAAKNEKILQILLDAKVDPNALDVDGRTCLYSAIEAGNNRLAELLLDRGDVNVQSRTNTGWTLLHIACAQSHGTLHIAKQLVKRKLEVEAITARSGKTALHLAAAAGNVAVVRYLLTLPSVSRYKLDAYGNTPLFCVCDPDNASRDQLVKLLAPWSPRSEAALNFEDRGSAMRKTALKWHATVVDFNNPLRAETVSIRQYLIWGFIQRSSDSAAKIWEAPHQEGDTSAWPNSFRWIHLPANNPTWCRDILAKIFVEKSSNGTHGFRDLERALHYQHQGQLKHPHSRYMTPMCQTIYHPSNDPNTSRNKAASKNSAWDKSGFAQQKGASSIVVPRPVFHPPEFPGGRRRSSVAQMSRQASYKTVTDSDDGAQQTAHDAETDDGLYCSGTTTEEDSNRNVSRHGTMPQPAPSSPGHLFMFMPYLHSEKNLARKDMSKAIQDAFKPEESTAHEATVDAHHRLFRAHLGKEHHTLHIRRTLDQFFYHSIDTARRDDDQVVHRYQRGLNKDSPSNSKVVELEDLMVDQLWMWVIDRDLVVTSFPRKWQSSTTDPDDVLERVKEIISSGAYDTPTNVYELAVTIVGCCAGAQDGQGQNDNGLKVLNMFESEVGKAMDQEVQLFRDFQEHARAASSKQQKKRDQSPDKISAQEKTRCVEALLNINKETRLLQDVKDIRDEIGMLKHLFSVQKQVIPRFQDAVKAVYDKKEWHSLRQTVDRNFQEQRRMYVHPLENLRALDRQAEMIYDSIRVLLDLKQKHVNALEASYAREQAESSAKQGRMLTIFTIVTVLFLPLSFIAAFFAIPITEYPRDQNSMTLPLDWVAEYMFGVGLPVALFAVCIAFCVGPLSHKFSWWHTLWSTGSFGPKPADSASGPRRTLTSASALQYEHERVPTTTGQSIDAIDMTQRRSNVEFRTALLGMVAQLRPKPQIQFDVSDNA